MTSKNTHTITNLNEMIEANLKVLINGETIKDKREARKKIIMLEKLIKDVDYKLRNGKKDQYRENYKVGLPTTKKDLLALIDSVKTPKEVAYPIENLSGAYISDDRTTEFPRTSILDLYNTK